MKNYLFAAVCLLPVACSSSEGAGTTTSSITGALNRASFPSEPAQVTATDEQGASASSVPDAAGTFTLSLTKGHKYKLDVVLANGSEPIVFPRSSGSLDKAFRVSSGAAIVNLGAVHHLNAAPSGGFVVMSLKTSANAASGVDDKSDGECENGVDAVTRNACVDDQGSMTCEHGHDGHRHSLRAALAIVVRIPPSNRTARILALRMGHCVEVGVALLSPHHVGAHAIC